MSILARLVILCFVFHTWHATASAAAKNDGSVDGIRVAIVGAGIGGSAAAYYLRQELAKLDRNADVKIDVYESSDRTCGRMMAMDVEGQRYEVGAAVAHPKNQYMAELLAAAGDYKTMRKISLRHTQKLICSGFPDRPSQKGADCNLCILLAAIAIQIIGVIHAHTVMLASSILRVYIVHVENVPKQETPTYRSPP